MRKLLFPEVVRSSAGSSVRARDHSVSRILFSLSLSPCSSLCKYFFSHSQSWKSIFTFVGEVYVVDVT